jgi:S-methylmethionine-dependent homocysteine/selenocysteine methylase
MTYREHLPQLDGGVFLTDGGIETYLIFHDGFELPEFAAFPLVHDEDGAPALRRYYERYARLASERGLGLVLEAPTWRASSRWAAELGWSEARLERVNRDAIGLMAELRDRHEGGPVVISGNVGPQDDAYRPGAKLSAEAAHDYHRRQLSTFADTEADMVCALTLTYAEEGVGIARAAAETGIPAAISFTVETDGRLPSGQPLAEAIAQVEEDSPPAYFMLNCAHPSHFDLPEGESWTERIHGLRANASTLSHAELDEAEELDEGDPTDLAGRYVALRRSLPRLNVLGGCCGTDHRHVAAIRDAWLEA